MDYFIYFIVNVLLLSNLSAQQIQKVEAVLGLTAELPCNVTAEKKHDMLTVLAWYKNSSTAIYSRDLRGGEDPTTTSSDDRYILLVDDENGMTLLQINNVSRRDKGIYQCSAHFAASPTHKTYIELEIIEPPVHLWVLSENGTQVAKASTGVNTSRHIGPYYLGDMVHLVCVAYGGKPQASISWQIEQRLVKSTWKRLSDMRVRSDLHFGPLLREDQGRVFTCSAANNEIVSPLYIDITIDMYVPPSLITVRSEDSSSNGSVGRVRAGEALQLQCHVLGARPLPKPVWKIGANKLINLEQNITMEQSQRLVVSEIQLSIERENDEALVTCCAPAYTRAGEQFTCAPPLPLIVSYPPVLKIVVNEEVVNNTLAVLKGTNLSLACEHEANPSIYELHWYHKEIFITNNTTSNNENLQHVLMLTEVTESDAGKYYCVASNVEGSTCSDPITIDVTYPAYCIDEERTEYGVGENDVIEINCTVEANPRPISYRWVIVNEAVDASTFQGKPHTTVETEGAMLSYQRPNETVFSTIFCWGENDVPAKHLAHTPCTFLITDETIPRPPTNCEARKNTMNDIVVSCDKGYNGGLDQRFKFIVQPINSDEHLMSIISADPIYKIDEPKSSDYKFVITAFNDRGESKSIEIDKDSIIVEKLEAGPGNTVKNITTLALALCGGVALVALAACGLVLCTYERSSRLDLPRSRADPPLCAYNTEESNCETCHDSDDGSECNVRRTESFRRAVSRQPSKNFDVRRTSSFHSARYMQDAAERDAAPVCNDVMRHSSHCRVHSLQNISRKRDMDALCDHLVLHLPPETNYNVPRPMNTFYTMPRKMRHKLAKELSDENSEITQTSDGFSLPPPPDEFTTYRAGARIKDMPTKSVPTYTTVIRKNSTGRDPSRQQYNNVIISPMNTVGLPTVSGQPSVYSYPDDESHHGHQDTQTTNDVMTTFQTHFRKSEL